MQLNTAAGRKYFWISKIIFSAILNVNCFNFSGEEEAHLFLFQKLSLMIPFTILFFTLYLVLLQDDETRDELCYVSTCLVR